MKRQIAIACGLLTILVSAAPAQVSENASDDSAGPVTRLPDDLMLIDGDIAVPRGFDESRATYDVTLWPNGVIPFEYGAGVTAANQTRMQAALDEWESLANVVFVPHSGENNFIRILNATFNASEGVGQGGGMQRIWISNWTTHGTLVHEVGHALAFYHEQSRADRNQFVTVNFGNVCQNCCSDENNNPISCNSQFTIRSSGGEYGPYDFGSVMHYSACAFSTCVNCAPTNANCATITVLAPNNTQWQAAIGQRAGASYWDGRVMSFLYPESDWRFADAGYGGINLGTFFFPWATFAQVQASTPTGGTIFLKDGNYSALGRWGRPMKIEAAFEPVRLGN